MTFFSLIAALFLEQLRPLRQGNAINAGFGRYSGWLEAHLNGADYRHGLIAWFVAALPPAAAAAIVYYALAASNALLGWLWNVAVLYVVMGLRQFSHYVTDITRALREGDTDAARQILTAWQGQSAQEFTPREIARVTIEQGLLSAHRHVFGVLVWFVAFGAAGAVFYRIAAKLAERWGRRRDEEFGEFGEFARAAFRWIEWVPVRLTAASFAIVGNFEDAVYCWRTQATSWPDEAQGILLASAAGALGVRLGEEVHRHGALEFRPGVGLQDEADADYLQSAIGLIWRALAMWLLLILLATLASWFG